MGYMSGGSYHKPLMEALKEAGFILKRRAVSSHYVMQRPLTDQLDRPPVPPIIVPNKLDFLKLAKRIAKAAGVEL